MKATADGIFFSYHIIIFLIKRPVEFSSLEAHNNIISIFFLVGVLYEKRGKEAVMRRVIIPGMLISVFSTWSVSMLGI